MESKYDTQGHRTTQALAIFRPRSGVTSPSHSCQLSLSDSFVSQSTSIGHVTRTTATLDSFSSLSSTETDLCPVTSQVTLNSSLVKSSEINESPTEEKTRRRQPKLARPVSRCPEVAFDPSEISNEKQRLIVSPKHSSSFPVLKKFSVTTPSYNAVLASDLQHMMNTVYHRKSDSMVFHACQVPPNSTLVTSNSFFKQISEKLRVKSRKDGTAASLRSFDLNPNAKHQHTQATINTSPEWDGSRAELNSDVKSILKQHAQPPNRPGSKALLIQK
ncbi:uncharacterized protein LOC131949643, partial [Physella acuta]|uniref:uncharacterized protein LOC131949643 n=1 Tax=Physella acuta TaxID=109671 RepID=UPI0027DBADCE